MLRLLFLCGCGIFTFFVCVAQPIEAIDSTLWQYGYFCAFEAPEKVYLHTDKQVYCAGEYIWFNAYLENSSPLSLLPESNYVYVELIKDSVLTRVMIKRNPQGFAGRIAVASDFSSGTYMLRAYSAWMRNFPDAYMYHKEITIIHPLQALDVDKEEEIDDAELFDIQFLPESGRYLFGHYNEIAYKAVDAKGRGLEVSGVVYNSRDSAVVLFSDSYYGMGKFLLYPKEGERYYAVVQSKGKKEVKATLPLPVETGAAIHITARSGKRYVTTILTESLLDGGLYLVLSNGGEVFFWNRIKDKEYRMAIEEAQLLGGINHATIVDAEGNVYAQRLFFVYPTEEIDVSVIADKEDPKQREKVSYTIQLLDTKQQGVEGTFSLSVTDQYLVPEDSMEHLQSYMLLSSELAGPVENADAYFDTNRPEMREAMDLLMMTSGWRYYDFPVIFGNTAQEAVWEKEYAQSLSGKVTGVFNRVSRANIVVYAPSIDLSRYHALDKSGLFTITELDFSDSTCFVLSCSGVLGSSGYYLEMDNPSYPSVAHYPFIGKTASSLQLPSEDIVNELARTFLGEKVTQLEPAVVLATSSFIKPTINPSPFNQLFEPGQIKERKQLAPFDNMLLTDYLISSFGSLSYGGIDSEGRQRIRSTSAFSATKDNEPVVYIDKIKMENTGDFDNIFLSEIENLVVFRSIEAGALYNSPGGVILISRRRDFATSRHVINTKLLTPQGWQKPSRFYSPNGLGLGEVADFTDKPPHKVPTTNIAQFLFQRVYTAILPPRSSSEAKPPCYMTALTIILAY